MDVAPDSPLAGVGGPGTARAVEPVPSSPKSFRPHHVTLPRSRSAHAKKTPQPSRVEGAAALAFEAAPETVADAAAPIDLEDAGFAESAVGRGTVRSQPG